MNKLLILLVLLLVGCVPLPPPGAPTTFYDPVWEDPSSPWYWPVPGPWYGPSYPHHPHHPYYPPRPPPPHIGPHRPPGPPIGPPHIGPHRPPGPPPGPHIGPHRPPGPPIGPRHHGGKGFHPGIKGHPGPYHRSK